MLHARAIMGNRQRLDGGAMFGNAPRALWSRWCPPDADNRIDLACRALLIDAGSRKILFETGIGSFFAPNLRERYGVVESEHVLLDGLARHGLSDADIDVVVLSHLHFDHAGGLLATYAPGEPPRLLFPRAEFIVGQTAFERALEPNPRDRASFIPELPALLQATGRLVLVEHASDAQTLLGPEFSFDFSNGHTPGLLLTTIRGARVALCFCSDLAPGVPWVHAPITMGYDRSPELLVDEKASLFGRLLQAGAWLFFTHDARTAAARLTASAARFGIASARENFDDWDLDEDGR
jgi:glyoxylase-like metal-dependent hydrolase (beta-lactamase superfamily II)